MKGAISHNRKISVFGSTGFIGTRFCQMYPDDVIQIPRNAYCPASTDVLYFISTTHNYHVFTNPYLDVETNLLHLLRVLEQFRANGGEGVFNFISSWFVYGDTDLPAREDSVCRPKGFYSITKKAAEDLLISYSRTFGLKYRILRLSNVYGPNDKGVSKKKNALQFLIGRLKEGKPIDLYHGGNIIRDYMHVDDVCRAIRLVVCSSPENVIINVGSGNPYRLRDILNIAIDELQSDSEIRSIEPPEFHKIVQVRDMYLDVTRLRALGFRPTIDIDKGVRELCHLI